MSITPSKETGLRLSQGLDQLLEVLPSHAEEKLVEGVSRCFGRGHPLPEETSTSSTAVLVKDFAQQLRKDPSRRHFVVDRDSIVTDDAGWLVAARCALPNMPLQWAITTVRSLERNVYENCYETEWKVQHATGPRGSAVVTKRGAGDSNACHQAFFSDMPSFVSATGKQLGSLYPSHLIVRVLRTSPRSSLNDRLTRILQQTNVPDNVFTLWIRHHEAIADLPGLGKYRYHRQVKNKHSIQELLTDIVEEQEDENLPSSPLAHDFVQASQAPPQRCRPRPPLQSTPKTSAPQTRAFAFDVQPKITDNDIEKDTTVHVSTNTDEVPAKDKSTTLNVTAVPGKNSPNESPGSVDTCDVKDLVAEATAVEEAKSSTPDIAEVPELLAELKNAELPIDPILQTSSSKQETAKIDETTEFDAFPSEGIHTVNTTVFTEKDSASKNLEDTRHKSLTTSEEKSVNSLYDDLEIAPTFSFDEDDVAPLETDNIEGYVNPTPCTERKNLASTKPEHDTAVLDDNGPNTQDHVVIKTKVPNIDEKSDEFSNVEREVVVQAAWLQAATEAETVPGKTKNLDPELNQSSTASLKRQTKTVRCVGCGTKKDKSDFSNSQLKKKKNTRCLQCVRGNRLGPSNND